MAYHLWGDSWPYWDDLHSAISRIQGICWKYGRIHMGGKEKYGTFRDELMGLWDGTIHNLLYPGFVYIQYKRPDYYYRCDYPIVSKVTTIIGLKYLVNKYQAAVYNYAIQSTVKKYPYLKDELTHDLNGYWMVKPGIFGPLDGKRIHESVWTSTP
jgi:hypothetical protein